MPEKIGVAIITCNREESFRSCYATIPLEQIDYLVIVNDGEPYEESAYYNGSDARHRHIIQNSNNLGVCKSKNVALKDMIEHGCDYIFIIEDDILIKNVSVFQKYIDTYKATGIHHLSFGFHGPANRRMVSHGPPTPVLVVEYENESICMNANSVGAFCFYTRACLEKVGLFDENFYQAFDHVEHTYRISKAGMTTPYWWFADINKSWEYLDEIACSEESSTIRFKDPKAWEENIRKAAMYFKSKHGYLPAWKDCVPYVSSEEVLDQLRKIYENRSR